MSLDVRVTYLNWILGTSLGIALWYRNVEADRPLGLFLIALSLIFLVLYGITNVLEPDMAGRLIIVIFGIALFVLAAGTIFTYGNVGINNLILVLTLVFLIWMLFRAFTDESLKAKVSEWSQGGSFIMESSFIIFLLLFFVMLFNLANLSDGWLLGFLALVLLILIIVVAVNCEYQEIGYYFVLLVLLILLLYWILPYFNNDLHQKIIYGDKLRN